MKHLPLSRRSISSFAILALSFTFASGHAKDDKGWKAGVSSLVITPTEAMWMAGYGDRDRPSEGKLVDLWVKALVLQDANDRRAVIITADLLGIPKALSYHITNQLFTKYKLSRPDIIINTSHTHTGPVLTNALVDIYPVNEEQQKQIDQYTTWLGDKIVKLVGDAMRAMQPVQVYAGNGVSRFQVNRRNNSEATLSRQTELRGPNDYAVPVIKVVNSNGKIMAVAFGYACHNTVLSGYKFSGDYAGYAQLELEKAYPGAAALFFQGCGADLNPLPRRTVPLARQYGQQLAASVIRVLNEDMRVLSPELATAYSEVDLPLNAPPAKEELLKKVGQPASNYQKRWASRLLKKMEAGEAIMTSYPYPVQIWKLGDQPIITLGGEVVVEYAIELKRLFGEDIFVMGYSNDVMAYIPSLSILREGGYEGESSQMVYGLPGTWKADIETIIIQKVLQLAKQVGLPTPASGIKLSY